MSSECHGPECPGCITYGYWIDNELQYPRLSPREFFINLHKLTVTELIALVESDPIYEEYVGKSNDNIKTHFDDNKVDLPHCKKLDYYEYLVDPKLGANRCDLIDFHRGVECDFCRSIMRYRNPYFNLCRLPKLFPNYRLPNQAPTKLQIRCLSSIHS